MGENPSRVFLFIHMTSHELANKLLAMPDVVCVILTPGDEDSPIHYEEITRIDINSTTFRNSPLPLVLDGFLVGLRSEVAFNPPDAIILS